MIFFDYKATEVWFEKGQIWVKLENGSTASDLLSNYPLLAKATEEQLQKFELIDGYALYWPELDEDLSIAGFFETSNQHNTSYRAETSLL